MQAYRRRSLSPCGRRAKTKLVSRGRCVRRSAGDEKANVSRLALAAVRWADLVGRRIALQPEPLPAAQHMLPELAMRPLRVVEQEDVLVPRLDVARSVRRPHLRCIAAVAEFRVVTLAAPGTGDSQHDSGPIACRSS